jgi:transposase
MISDYQSVMKRIITGDETWIYAYDPETTDQWSEYRAKGEPRPKRSRQNRSKIKVMLTIFFDYRGVVHYEFLPPGQTVNKEYYLSVMRRLREAIRKKRPELWKDNSWFLHHDNAPSHTALVLRDHFAKNSTHIVPQPPYSPDLAPCDFWLFPKLKRPLRGHRFDSIEEIQAESEKALKTIPEIDFNNCFEDWKKRWHRCIVSEGDYFEGDEIDLE